MSARKSKKHLVVISLDALKATDLPYIQELPHFKSFIKQGAYVKEVTSVYPSVTYTCHTSIITGTYPYRHGIFNNEKCQPEHHESQEWFWYEKDIKVPTLFDYARREGLRTANVLWPVMGGAPIDYNFPEVWSVYGKSYFSEYLKYATKNTLPLLLRNATKFKGKQQPNLDNFVEGVATDMILRKKPNLLCMHLIELDHDRHVNGNNPETNQVILNRLDERIGNIIEATKKAGIYDHTTFVLLGDHGSENISHYIYLNNVFKEAGLLKTNGEGVITSWKAYSNSCAGSTHIHVHPSATRKDREHIDHLLGNLSVMPGTFIKQLYSKHEVNERYGLFGDFEYVIEPKDGYAFSPSITNQLVIATTDIQKGQLAQHGQEPSHKELKTLFLAKGPGIKKGAFLEKAHIVDEGPTMAKLLGIDMENVDGKVLTELLR